VARATRSVAMNRVSMFGLAILAAAFVPSLAIADEKPRNRLYVRAGVAHIAPLEQSDEMELSNVDGPASLAVQNGPIAGSGATISSATVPAITVGYVLPFGGDKLSV